MFDSHTHILVAKIGISYIDSIWLVEKQLKRGHSLHISGVNPYISTHHYENIAYYSLAVRTYDAFIKDLSGIIALSSNPKIRIDMSEWNVSSGFDWRDHYAPNFIETTGNHNSLNVVSTLSEDGQEIYFKTINTSAANIPVALDTDNAFNPSSAVLGQIAPASLSLANSFINPEAIHVEEGQSEIDGQ